MDGFCSQIEAVFCKGTGTNKRQGFNNTRKVAQCTLHSAYAVTRREDAIVRCKPVQFVIGYYWADHCWTEKLSDSDIHKVGRVVSFFSSRRNWDSPNPSPAGECPPPGPRGERHTRLRERGWESPKSDEGTYEVC
jgi:hypothetical protein